MIYKNKIEKIVPDTSVIVEGLISKYLEKKQIKCTEIIIHEAVLAELESQANKNKETGYKGLREITNINKIAQKLKIKVTFKGSRPGDFEIKFAKSGEIDSIIRELALKEKALLITADKVQSLVAEAKGIPVQLYKFSEQKKSLEVEKLIDKETNQITIKENNPIQIRQGKPGNYKYKQNKKTMTKEEIEKQIEEIQEYVKNNNESYVETEKKGITIIQTKNLKIIITKTPISESNQIIINEIEG